MQLFALLLISGTIAQVAKILELGWSWCNLAPDRKRLFTAVVSLKTSNSPAAQTAMFLTFHSFVHLRCFLKVAVLHHFPSRVLLDAAVLRCCLFPVHFIHSAKHRNSPSVQTAMLVTLRLFVHLRKHSEA